MEIIALTSSVVLIISAVSQAANLSNKIIRLTQQASTADSRLQALKWRIRTEKLRSEEWCNNVVMNRTTIEPEGMTAVLEILVELREANDRISGRLNKYSFDKTTSVSRRLVTAAKWNNGGYDDAEDLADLMHDLNDCLVTLVPPLPSYSGPMHQDTQDNRSNAITPVSPAVDPSSERDHPISHTSPEIYSLYRGSVVALRALGSQDKPRIRRSWKPGIDSRFGVATSFETRPRHWMTFWQQRHAALPEAMSSPYLSTAWLF